MQTIPCINTIFFLRTLFQKNDRSVDIFTYKSGSEVVPFSPKEGDQNKPMIHRHLFAGVLFSSVCQAMFCYCFLASITDY